MVGVGGYFLGPRAWHWAERKYLAAKQQRALTQAKDFFAARDPAAAAAALQVALSAQPSNAGAWRTAADLVEQAGAREAIGLRRRVVELEPANPANRLALAQTALRFQEPATALETFAVLPDETKASPEGERLAVALSMAAQAAPIADALLADLEKKSPADTRLAFTRATLRLRHPRPEMAAEARTAVERFKAQAEYRLSALRELFLDAVARKETARALALAQELATAPGAGLGDKLSAANAELILGKKPLAELQSALAAQAAGSPADAVQFAQWLLVQQRVDEAKAWIAGLPPAIASGAPVVALKAEWALREKDWQTLQTLLRDGAWGPVSPSALQLAISASLLGSNEQGGLRAKLWAEALRAAQSDLPSLRLLHRLAASWGWPNEALETLVAVAEQFPGQTWAHDARVTLARRLKDTRGMQVGLELWRRVDPLSERLRYNKALLDVLLASGTLPDNAAARRDLEDLHRQHPENPTYTTSVAFALAKTGLTKEAMTKADTLPAEAAAAPARAPYLAYIYAMGRNLDRAGRFVAQAKGQSGELLPEESELLEMAQSRVENPGLYLPAKPKERKKA